MGSSDFGLESHTNRTEVSFALLRNDHQWSGDTGRFFEEFEVDHPDDRITDVL